MWYYLLRIASGGKLGALMIGMKLRNFCLVEELVAGKYKKHYPQHLAYTSISLKILRDYLLSPL